MNSSFINNADNYINVAVGIIEENGRILIAQRGQNQSHPGKWEFPGGKIEPGETSEDCLRRELFEELGIHVIVGRLFIVFNYNYNRPDKKIHRFYSFFCNILIGEPRLKVHDAFKWVGVKEFPDFDFIEADRRFVSALSADRNN